MHFLSLIYAISYRNFGHNCWQNMSPSFVIMCRISFRILLVLYTCGRNTQLVFPSLHHATSCTIKRAGCKILLWSGELDFTVLIVDSSVWQCWFDSLNSKVNLTLQSKLNFLMPKAIHWSPSKPLRQVLRAQHNMTPMGKWTKHHLRVMTSGIPSQTKQA